MKGHPTRRIEEAANIELAIHSHPSLAFPGIFLTRTRPAQPALPLVASRSSASGTHAPIAQSWRAASCVQTPRMGASGDRAPTRNWGLDCWMGPATCASSRMRNLHRTPCPPISSRRRDGTRLFALHSKLHVPSAASNPRSRARLEAPWMPVE
ncbi:hypothetical protein FB451DRAFT_403029 [Mycena latifolia]|nr:hypothetical protein FB451DRAFT_403029 [Mycena latifolia]